jgi:hypothetical protein|tara:strand:- start:549 stop:1286 length:738 start_codon:yes stop_codon:yes gene_type:complete
MAFKMKAGKEGPMRKNFGDAVTPMNFNAGLRAASKAGKLDNNPKFKAAVDKAPVKLKKDGLTTGTMDKRRNLKQMVNKVKDVVKKNPEVLAIGPAGLAISKAIKKRKSKLRNFEASRIKAKPKDSDSPKKFIGKALGGALSSALGGGGGLPSGISMGLGALGGLLNKRRKREKGAAVGRGRAMGPMMLKKTGGSVSDVDKKKERQEKKLRKKLERKHDRAARKTEGSIPRQKVRKKFGKNKPKKS